jgi:DHA2 family multidrug resistance protein
MMSTFGVNVDEIRWVVTVYMVTFAIVTLATGHLAAVFGLKRVYLAGLAVFTAGSLLCGAAWDLPSMVAFRVLQALGGGVIFPAAMIVITESFPPWERGTAFGTFGIVIVFAPTLGPTVGGYLVDYLSWRYIFTINFPVGILAFLAADMVLRPAPVARGRRFDWAGFAGLSLFIVGLLLALTDGQKEGWDSDAILARFAAAALGLALFLVVGRRAPRPAVDLGLFANGTFLLICLMNVLRAAGLFGRMFLLPIFMQNSIGYSPTATGWLMAPGALVAGLLSPLFGRLADRRGSKAFIVAGFALLALSMQLYVGLTLGSSLWAIFWPQLVYGLGLGMMNAPLSSTAMNAVRRDQIGMVSGLLSVLMQLGGAFGVALLGTALARREAFHRAAITERLTPDALGLGRATADLRHLFSWGGAPQAAGPGVAAELARTVGRQATVAAFADCYVILTAVAALGTLLALGLRAAAPGRRPPGAPAQPPAE